MRSLPGWTLQKRRVQREETVRHSGADGDAIPVPELGCHYLGAV